MQKDIGNHEYEPQGAPSLKLWSVSDKSWTLIPPQSSGVPASRQAGFTLRLWRDYSASPRENALLSCSTNKFFFTPF